MHKTELQVEYVKRVLIHDYDENEGPFQTIFILRLLYECDCSTLFERVQLIEVESASCAGLRCQCSGSDYDLKVRDALYS